MRCKEEMQAYLDRLEDILEMDSEQFDSDTEEEIFEIKESLVYLEDEVNSLNDPKLEKLLDKVKKKVQEVISEFGMYDPELEMQIMFPDGMPDEEDDW